MRFRVVSTHTELARNARFITIPADNTPGQLVAVETDLGVFVGRLWRFNGRDYLQQPERLIRMSIPYRTLGQVVEADPATVCLN